MKPDGDIVWPKKKETAKRDYLRFVLDVIDTQIGELYEHWNNPVFIARNYLNYRISKTEYENVTDKKDAYSEKPCGGRGAAFEELASNLARCLLLIRDHQDLSENLSWFIEVLYMYDKNMQDRALEMLEGRFNYKK